MCSIRRNCAVYSTPDQPSEGLAEGVGGVGGAVVGQGAGAGLLDVEDVDGLGAEGVDVGGPDGDVLGGEGRAGDVQDPDAVRRPYLDHRRVRGGLGSYGDGRGQSLADPAPQPLRPGRRGRR